VVFGEGSFDEISITGTTFVSELRDGKVTEYQMIPEDFGMPRGRIDDIRGGDAKENAAIVTHVLKGEEGPKRDMILLNAGAAFYASAKVADMKEGIEMAKESIDSGKAFEKLQALVDMTNRADA
jgi:anthranilate phosphoribosyltransferase